jgi:FkbM family methyltransferase
MSTVVNRQVAALGKPLSAVFRRYYLGIDHPFKLRLWSWIRRFQRYQRFTVPYAPMGWLTVDERCFIQRQIFVNGAYEPEVAETLLSRATEREVVWDVGANIGSFAVTARMDSRVDEVVCFEPDPQNRAILEANLALNPGATYRICPLALSAASEQRPLWHGPTINRGMSTLAGPVGTDGPSCIVECTTVDTLVFRDNFPAPTLMKIDVEGWEYQTLEGAQALFRQAPPKAIVLESRCRADGEIDNPPVCELLADYGYRIVKIARPSGSVDSQENFLASRPID